MRSLRTAVLGSLAALLLAGGLVEHRASAQPPAAATEQRLARLSDQLDAPLIVAVPEEWAGETGDSATELKSLATTLGGRPDYVGEVRTVRVEPRTLPAEQTAPSLVYLTKRLLSDGDGDVLRALAAGGAARVAALPEALWFDLVAAFPGAGTPPAFQAYGSLNLANLPAVLDEVYGRPPTAEELVRAEAQWAQQERRAKAARYLEWEPVLCLDLYLMVRVSEPSGQEMGPAIRISPTEAPTRAVAWRSDGETALAPSKVPFADWREVYHRRLEALAAERAEED